MDSIINISNLSDLKPFKSVWRVHVKVLHTWTAFNPNNGYWVHVKVLHTWTAFNPNNGYSLEMVLSDEKVRC
ncbi:unnamed protein product [Eruca vesicaria subsp. sativa]|uniref:DUF223 domain-containing protein n=1 Tax=Eruca vesicaria subsp. sativa TaxID=29727 RepID=A0ABC8KES2_ERUVS|nr:unnamed protein product [Eruca vesicaria subsp. sativa]